MGGAIGQILSLAVVVAISPVPIIAIVLMLGTPLARANGPAFLLGWIVGLAVVGTLILLVAGAIGPSDGGEPATWVGVLQLVLGGALLLLAVRQWRGRPRGDAGGEPPEWMRSIDPFTPGRSAATGLALAAINPKNLILTVGAATTVAQAGLSTGQEAIAMAVFVVIASLGPGIPVAIYFAMGERATRLLDEMKTWMGANNAAIMAVICLVIGVKLVGDGISALA